MLFRAWHYGRLQSSPVVSGCSPADKGGQLWLGELHWETTLPNWFVDNLAYLSSLGIIFQIIVSAFQFMSHFIVLIYCLLQLFVYSIQPRGI